MSVVPHLLGGKQTQNKIEKYFEKQSVKRYGTDRGNTDLNFDNLVNPLADIKAKLNIRDEPSPRGTKEDMQGSRTLGFQS